MKSVLALVSIALLMQISLVGSIRRVERDTDETPKFVDVLREFTVNILAIVKTVYDQMPDKYQEDWKGFWEKYVNVEERLCYMKMLKIINEFNVLINQYQTPTATEEEKQVYNLFEAQGLENLRMKYVESVENTVVPEYSVMAGKC